MTGTIVVGVIIALMFLVSFTEWFYHITAGVNEVVVRDIFLAYRVGMWVFVSIMFMGGVFWTLALTSECPLQETKVGIFKYMNCDVYWNARSMIERKPVSVLLEEAGQKASELDDKTKNSFLD